MKSKRPLLFVLSLLVFALPLFAACSSLSQPKAAFSQNEFVLSLNESINFYDYLKTENLSSFDLDFGGETLVAEQEDGTYKASQRGRGQVQVKSGSNVLASAKLIVKQKFNSPTSLQVDNTGLITWENIYVYDEGVVNASGYKLLINGQEENAVGASFQLPTKGRYTIAIKAIGTEYVDDSDYSNEMIVNYGIMAEPEITAFSTGSQYGSETASFTWGQLAGARYNVYINGILIQENSLHNSITFDFAQFNSYQDIRLKIDTLDSRGELLPSSKTFTLRKSDTPRMDYSFDGKDGRMAWQECKGASEYLLYCADRFNTMNTATVNVESNSTTLPGLGQGAYISSIQARGGKFEDGFYYLNSATSQNEFAKLGLPQFTYEINDNILILHFTEHEYIENYVLKADKEYEISTKHSLTQSINLSQLAAGKYTFRVYARPTTDVGGNVVGVINNGYTCAKVVNSDDVEFTIYVLEEFGAVTHTLVNDETILTFVEIENADLYIVTVNGLSTEIKEKNVADGIVSLNLGDLSEIAPQGGKYQFKITALREDRMAVGVQSTKEISILELVTKAESQLNGSFAWNNVVGDAEYYYEIYSVDKDFTVGQEVSSAPLFGRTTSEFVTKERLPFGYYVIRIYSRTTDLDNYLNSDYHDAKGYFEDKFYVTEQIETPDVTMNYDKGTDSCVLTISKVDYAGRYIVYVDGVREGAVTPTNSTLTEYNYTLKDRFVSGKSVVTVVAEVYNGESGSLNNEDATLHPASEAATLNVTRLDVPKYTVSDEEVLTVVLDDNASELTIVRNSSPVEFILSDKLATLDLSDETKWFGDFELTMKFIANEPSENNYYLDSALETYKFRRTAQPSNIRYSNGVLSYGCQDAAAVEKYLITLTLITSYGNHSEVIEAKGLSFNISEYIQNRLNSSEEFSDNYAQSTGITLEVSAYKLGLVSGVFYIPSRNGATSTGGDKLSLSQLEAPNIIFDTSAKRLTWNAVGVNTIYSVYVDDVALATNISDTQMLLSGLDFSTEKRVKVFASNAEYLTSSSSNEISIRQLGAPTTVNVTQSGMLSFSIPTADVAKLKEIRCNNSTQNINLSMGSVSLDLHDFSIGDTANLAFEIIAADADSIIENGKTINCYYINSAIATYRFIDIADKNIAITGVSDGKIVWDTLTQFQGTPGNVVTYTLVIHEGDRVIERITGLSENTYSLSELRDKLTATRSLSVEIVIDDYQIKSGGGTSQGYFGTPNGEMRLDKIESVSYSFVGDNTLTNEVDRAVQAKVQLEWKDKWNGTATFVVSINGANFENLTAGAYGDNYTFTREENDGQFVYKLSLNDTLFAAGQNTVLVTAMGENTSSDTLAFRVRRYGKILALNITDDGMLTIKPDFADMGEGQQPTHFLIGLRVQGKTQYIRYEDNGKEKTYNLLQHFNIEEDGKLIELSGIYTIEVIAYDDNGLILSSVEKNSINGYRLSGVDVSTTDRGMVEINVLNQAEIDENITFVARRKRNGSFEGEGVEFSPERRGSSGVFEFSIIGFIDLFLIEDAGPVEIEVSVRKPGSLNAAWAQFKFEYASGDKQISLVRGKNHAEDFLRIGEIDGVQSKSFKVESQYINEDNEIVRLIHIYTADEVRGYWAVDTNQNIEYFTKSIPSLEPGETEKDGIIYTPCYAINLNEFFDTAAAGAFPIKISRVAYSEEGGYHIQYNASNFSVTKLPTVTNISLRDDRLTWTATADGTVSGYYVYLNYREGDELISAAFQETHEAYLQLQNILVAGRNYEITVVSVSSVAGRLASKPTSAININKYLNPMQLEVRDGVIAFNLDDVAISDFATSVSSASGNNIWRTIASSRFSSMFTFSAGTISSTYIELSFTSESREYRTRVRAIDLIPDLSKVDVIRDGVAISNLMDWILNSLINPDYNDINCTTTIAVYNALKNASHGIATDQILFDDFGSSIPSGTYNVAIRQVGIGEMGTVSSNFNAATSLYVAGAPTLTLSSRRVEDTKKNEYFIRFKPVNISQGLEQESIIAEKYTLNIKTFDGEIGYYFDIVNQNGKYKIVSYSKSTYDRNGRRQYQFFDNENGFAGMDLSIDEISTDIVINMTQLSTLVGIEKLQYNASIYAKGNGYTTNSKSNVVVVTLLDLNLASLKVDDGVMSWVVPAQESGYTTMARYYINNSLREQTVSIDSSGVATLDLRSGGRYNYLLLFVLGNYTATTLTIDSPTYRINELYKLNDPSVNAVGNILNIRQSAAASGVSSDMFKVTNERARASQDAATLVYRNTFTNGSFAYMAGLQGLQSSDSMYAYKLTEQTATEYYISNIGTSGRFDTPAVPSEAENNCDYVLNFIGSGSADKLILSSSEIVFKAKMLDAVTSGMRIENGDIVWDANVNDENLVPEDYKVVYKLTADYYKKDSLVPTQSSYFTAKTSFNTVNLPSLEGDEHFIFSLQRYIMKIGGTGANAIQTVEGDVYSRSAVKYSGQEVYVLASEPVTLGGHESSTNEVITKSQKVEKVEINNGNLNWKIPSGTNTNNLKFQIVDGDGNIIDGVVSYSSTTDTYSFRDNMLTYRGGIPYKLKVFSFYTGEASRYIKSDPVDVQLVSGTNVETDVFKLPDITEEDFTISADQSTPNRYRIDLSNFYTSHPIRGSQNYYKVNMTVKVWSANGETKLNSVTVPANDNIYKFFLLNIGRGSGSDIVVDETSPNVITVNAGYAYSISFQTVDAQGLKSLQLLNGNQSDDIFITPASFLASDKVIWNESIRQFEWTYGGQPNNLNGLYRVVVSYGLGGGQTTTEEAEVADKFFKPTVLGWITDVKVYVRKDASSLYSAQPIEASFNPNIDNRIFGGGSGTQISPYLIANKQHFYNIQYKNERGLFYRQTANLELSDDDAEFWRGSLKGNYDGDGYRITFTSSSFSASEASVKPTGVGEMKFGQEMSLFKEIVSGARVSNLKLSISFGKEDNPLLIDQNTIFAGFAITNNGTISNVTLDSFDTWLTIRASVAMGFSGFVVNNESNIIDCQNNVNFNLSTSPSYTGSIMYSGVAMTNGYSGAITRTFNTGNVDINLRRNGTIAYVSGITLFNDRGTLAESGNDGNLSVGASTSTGYTGYVAGICLRSSGAATIRYCYNNGQLSCVKTDYVGGIAYNVTESNLIGVVTTASGIKFIATYSNEPSVQNSYCYAGDACEGIATNDFTGEDITISCGDGHNLVITKNEDDSYTAKIM